MGTFWPLLLLSIWTGHCAANGNVGCLFSEELCRQETEWCFDDGAFGRCININDPREPHEHYRHALNEEELAILEGELKKLLEMGYRWSHSHTQCLLQAVLFAFQTGSPLDSSMCDQYRNSDLQAALASTNEEFDPNSLAYIKFTPSAGSDFADEVYYPPPDEGEDDTGGRGRLEVRGEEEELPPPYVVRRSLGTHFSPAYNSPDSFRSGLEVRDFLPQEEEPRINMDRPYAALRSLTSWPQSDEMEGGSNEIEGFDPEQLSMSLKNILKPSYMLFKTPAKTYSNDKDEIEYEVENEQGRFLQLADDGRGYTEGGTVYPSDQDSLPELIDKLNGALGFKRPERLDVKKPGPPYDPAFQVLSSLAVGRVLWASAFDVKTSSSSQVWCSTRPTASDDRTYQEQKNGGGGEKPQNKSQGEKEDIANELPPKSENNYDWPKKLNALKKKANPIRVMTTPDYDVIDTNFAYINLEESSIRSWDAGKKIIDVVARILKLPNDSFSHSGVNRNEVTFKVNEKKAGMNASEVAKKIEAMKEEISKEIGVKILSTGIGYKTAKLPTAVRLDGRSDHEVYVVSVVVVGVLAALALSAAVLYLTKKHGHKIRAHVKSEGEPMSKLYQDLCRARMSTKTPSEKESAAPTQRIASLSKESDKESPSSRSSTSSWSEEPALTNMDVATGQMVLSYMEEHLKNKERLESEWTALCAYEADPSATTIAQRAENLQKNRYPHALPYDHARVVLNELSNITGSDYINASTITDHDPRNPAYIVTQGPLAHTAPDLWQMVWEQGCVAMVMLTRLGEADSPLCYHYWPEEGSETYHVYEVHLVSEHIWCDDYLVRSFYLKNLKTGETRTVTQFHFMSWSDGGVPGSTKPLLEFRRKVNKSFRGRSCPMVVHCSDGVGRSGAYVLLDMVLNRIAKGAKEIDVGATLEHIRDQRAGAVRTKQQFQFVLQAVADEVQAILKLLPQP